MSDVRDRITPRVRRCEWCGHRCKGTACRFHADLPNLLANYYAAKGSP